MPKMAVRYPTPTAVRWAVWQWCDIPSQDNPGQVYLRRLRLVQTPWFSVMLHWINEPDVGRYAHDHPWTFYSFILRGNYREDVWPDEAWMYKQKLPPLMNLWCRYSIHRMPFGSAHRIVHASEGLVTMVVTGKRQQVFRFWTDDKPVTWYRVHPKEVNDID